MNAMAQLRTQALARWQALSPREQRSVSVLAVLLGVLVFWSIAIAPARHTLNDSDHRRDRIGQQQASMLALQAQAQALHARTPLSREEALRSLQSLTPSAHFQLNVQGERVMVQLKAVPAPTLASWLTQARNQAQALPIEAHLTRGSGSASATGTDTDNAAPTAAMPSDVVWNGNVVLSLPNRGTPTR
jgi:general secretion pathway protein M